MTDSNAVIGSDSNQDSNHEAPTSDESIERETLRDDSYRGVSYEVVRTNEDDWTSGFEYEFVLFVEGEPVITATELEARGYVNPWLSAMDTYVQAYIDGRED